VYNIFKPPRRNILHSLKLTKFKIISIILSLSFAFAAFSPKICAKAAEFEENKENLDEAHVPKVSIIVPVYNTENYLTECLESLQNQTLRDIEIICVNDCSTDSSPQILQKFAEDDPRFVVINMDHKIGRIPAVPRNAALPRCRGEYVTFVDSDDIVAAEAYEKSYAAGKKDDADIVAFGVATFGEKNYPDFIKTFNATYRDSSTAVLFDKPSKYPQWVYPNFWHKLFKRQMIIDNELKLREDVGYSDDWFFNYDAFMSANTIVTLSDTFYFWRQHRAQTSNAKPEAANKISLGYFNAFTDFLEKYKDRPDLAEVKEKFVARFLFDAIRPVYGACRKQKKELFTRAAQFLNNEYFDDVDVSKFEFIDKVNLYNVNRGSREKLKISRKMKEIRHEKMKMMIKSLFFGCRT
jgi:glycosyltransferase involved in cell wall biosynthesis